MSGPAAMIGPNHTDKMASSPDLLDRAMVLYLTVPLALFLGGWFRPGVAVVLLLALAVSLSPLIRRRDSSATPVTPATPAPGSGAGAAGAPRALTRGEIALAIGVGLAWTLCGGTGHWLFANPDWQVRDAVLHDLVAGHWPVGYGSLDGAPSILRAPLGFYLPAALVGKLAGLNCAHIAMAAWTALGATLFLIAVISLVPARRAAVFTALAVVVLFSGLDLVGNLAYVPDFLAHWQPGQHLEWWAARYQYSSMTTQLFWVPNHALGGWLAIALLARSRATCALDTLWLLIVVALALASPLAALGLVPFVLWRLASRALEERTAPAPRALQPRGWVRTLQPRSWAPALLIGLALASYLTLDAARIPKGWTFGRHGLDAPALAQDFVRQGVFFVLEAGLVGCAVLTLLRSSEVVLALLVLALLPLVSFGAANDLVMRASIPSLTVLAIAAALALVRSPRGTGDAGNRLRGDSDRSLVLRKSVLGALLLVGAVTPLEEFARAILLPRWPVNLEARLIEASCGAYPAHYIARLREGLAARLLRAPQALAATPGTSDCHNPATQLMRERGLL